MGNLTAVVALVRASLRKRFFATTVSVFAIAIALGVVGVTGVVTFAVAQQVFESGRKYPLIVAAEGSSETQVILSTLFHIDKPRGKIPFDTYESLKKDPRVTAAFPIAAADSLGVFPIIGTDGTFVKDFGTSYRGDIALADPHDAVLGATVARQLLMDVGTEFAGTHGMGGSADEADEHGGHTYTVKGILDSTGGPEDAAVYVSYRAVWAIHQHGEHHENGEHEKEDHDRYHLSDGMLTAVMARTGNPVQVFELQQEYSRPGLTAVNTAGAVRSFQKYFNTAGLVAAFFAGLTLLIAAALILAIVLLAQEARRRELALLRILGVGRGTIALLVMLESLVVTAAGLVAGLVIGHLVPAVFAVEIGRAVGARIEPWHIGANEIHALVGALILGQAVAVIAMIRVYRMNLVEESAKN